MYCSTADGKLLEAETSVSVVPFMQPGNLCVIALSNSSGDIQRPSWLTPPSTGEGTVSLWSGVTITVLLSTRATSLGSVLANQLQQEEEEEEEEGLRGKALSEFLLLLKKFNLCFWKKKRRLCTFFCCGNIFIKLTPEAVSTASGEQVCSD